MYTHTRSNNFCVWEKSSKQKNHKPKVEMQERIINPPIGEKNRESNHIFLWEKYGLNGRE